MKKKGSPAKTSVLWDKKHSKENRDTPNMQKVSDTRTSLKQRRFPYESFRYCETKKIQAKIVI